MTLVSMTGFARIEEANEDCTWVFEVKSVNGKSLDLRTRLPNGLEALEPELKKLATGYFGRGSFQLNLQLSYNRQSSGLAVNQAALDAVLQAARSLQKQLDGPPIRAEQLLSLRGVLEMVDRSDDGDTIAARKQALLASAQKVFAQLAKARADEGAHMSAVIAGQIDKIEQLTIAARDCPARQPGAIKTRFEANIARLLDSSDKFDADRLHTEALLIATRADVQEELDRLFAHIEAARLLLESEEVVGRKFDFLAQEFNREANTLCSKANDKTLSQIGLEMKATIDQLREQVQNIE